MLLTLGSCNNITIDNSSEKTFGDSFRKIQSSLDRDDQIKFEIACLVLYSQETSNDDLSSYDVNDLKTRTEFRNIFANKTAGDIIDQADNIMEKNQNLKLQMMMIEIGIKGRDLGVFDN
jgi:hypothetical protein